MKSGVPWIGGALVAVSLLAVFWYHYGPYNTRHMRNIVAWDFRENVRNWNSYDGTSEGLAKLQKTNDDETVFFYQTNVAVEGVNVQFVIGLSNALLQGKGFLASTTNAEVFWISSGGRVKKLN
jgi:hypothetical protein